jgi:hypothetical protein
MYGTEPLWVAREQLAIEYEKELAKGLEHIISNEKPLIIVSVSKIGHEDKYHFYYDIYDVEPGDMAEVYVDDQVGDDFDDQRFPYVVSIGGDDVGELTENAIEKVEEHTPWDKAFYIVKSATESDSGRPMLKLSVYQAYTGIPGHRVWNMDLRGINFEGRAKILKENGENVCKLDPVTFEGEPAVRALDALDRELGWVPKEYADEVTKHINKGKISKVSVSNIKYKEDKVYANLTLVIKQFVW